MRIKVMLKQIRLFMALVMVLVSITIVSRAGATEQAAADIKPVETSLVCMVNDTVMGKAQIPVEVDGKTYYGCCMGCVERLKTDITARTAKDPATGNDVDKAKAIIGTGPKGEALYFESLQSFNTFMQQTGKGQ